MTPSPDRPALEVADVIRQYGAAFRARYGRALTAEQRKTASTRPRSSSGVTWPPTARTPARSFRTT